jgi:hypothetical protein
MKNKKQDESLTHPPSEFDGLSAIKNRLPLDDPGVQAAIRKALRYLGIG